MKKLMKDYAGIAGIGVFSGVGSTMVGSLGGSTAGFTAMANNMPLMANVTGGMAVLRQFKGLTKMKKWR